MYAMPVRRAMEYGFVSHYNHTGDPVTDRLANDIALTSEQMWWLLTNPFSLAVALGGWGGVGLDPTVLPQLLPCVPWAVVFLLLRVFCQRRLSRLGLHLRVVVPVPDRTKGDGAARLTKWQRTRLKKFQNQLWLATFYTVSTVFGYVVQRDKPWFGLPVNEANRIGFLTPHPYMPDPGLLYYYQYALGFYLSETVSLFLEDDIRRSDFIEYLVHHIVTFALIVLSHCGYEHRFGVYVLFIHDASDIMLAVGKAVNYVSKGGSTRQRKSARTTSVGHAHEVAPPPPLQRFLSSTVVSNVALVAFILLFVFFRLICLPSLALASLVVSMKVRTFTLAYWVLIVLLHVVLQGLHVYWFMLIVRVAMQTIMRGTISDIRSEDDDDDADAKKA